MMQTIELTKGQFDTVQLGAYMGGQRMAEVGAPRTACPYLNTRLRDAWFAGYDAFQASA